MKEVGEEWSVLLKIVSNMSELHKACMRLLEISIEYQVWNLIVFGTRCSRNHICGPKTGWSFENSTPIITRLVTIIPEIHIWLRLSPIKAENKLHVHIKIFGKNGKLTRHVTFKRITVNWYQSIFESTQLNQIFIYQISSIWSTWLQLAM